MSILNEDYKISNYKTDSWVLETTQGHYILTNQAKKLVDILTYSISLDQARGMFNQQFEFDLNTEEFTHFINEKLGFTGLLTTFKVDAVKPKSFINLQFTIFKAEVASVLSKPLTPFFNKIFFWISFPLLMALSIYFLITLSPEGEDVSIVLLMGLYLITIFFHELGHITACKRYTGSNGEIGGGLYLIFPVMYSNISSLWHAKKVERVIGNLAGVYMQLWCLLFFVAALYFFPQIAFLKQMIFLLSLYSIIQLLPFVRSDGYWLLSDLTNTPNLLMKSNEALKNVFSNPKAFFVQQNFIANWALLLYGSFNNLIMIYFVSYQLYAGHDQLLNFPFYIWDALNQLIHLQIPEIDFSYITVIIFYIIGFTYLKRGYAYLSKPREKLKEVVP